jgi:hypothetical protein
VRIREVTFVVVIAGTGLVGCTGSGSDDSSPYCRELSAAAQRIAAAQTDLYSDARDAQRAMRRLMGDLRGLQADAPARISSALTELGRAFQTAQGLLQHPHPSASAQLAEVAQTLGRDGRKITRYVASQCR